jgi:hypothetical protein
MLAAGKARKRSVSDKFLEYSKTSDVTDFPA